MKSSPSAPSDDIDNISQHSDDDEDDRALSPQLPLQLTVHERGRSPSSPPHIECETRIKLEDDKNDSPMRVSSEDLKSDKNNESKNDDDGENQGFNRSNNNNDESVKSNNSIDHSSNSPHPRSPSPSEDLDIDDQDTSQMDEYRSPSPLESKRDLLLPMMNPNSMFSHSIMYMSHYIPAMQSAHQSMQSPSLNASGLNLTNSFSSSEERRKRNRTFIDPVTEVPKLEQWFSMNTHPSHNLILKYTEDLNRMPYR
jgi:homeobox domain-containing protein